jgi:hypothetical protein
MIKRLSPLFRGLDIDLQVFLDLVLAGKILK